MTTSTIVARASLSAILVKYLPAFPNTTPFISAFFSLSFNSYMGTCNLRSHNIPVIDFLVFKTPLLSHKGTPEVDL